MKIGIISDTHRNIKSIDKAIPYLKECDLIIHAGDNIDDAEYIYYATDVLVKCVKGNCDLYNIDEPYELTFLVKDKKFFLCHGHQYDVKWGFDSLLKIAKDNNIDINPGSTTYPRGGSECGFGILTLDNDISYKEIKI